MAGDKKTLRLKARFMIPAFLALLLTGCADNAEGSIYNFADVEPKDIDPWTYLKETSITDSLQIRSLSSSSYRLAVTVGIMGIVFSILYMAIRMLFTQNAKLKNEVKEEAVLKGLIAIAIFSIPLWLSIFKMMGELLI